MPTYSRKAELADFANLLGDITFDDIDSAFSGFEKPQSEVFQETSDSSKREIAHQHLARTAQLGCEETHGEPHEALEYSDGYEVDSSDEGESHSDSDDEITKAKEGKQKLDPETRRTKGLSTFLNEILDPNLEEMAGCELSRPFCCHPGCGLRSDIQCDDCIGYFCKDHHHDEHQTHTTRMWQDKVGFCARTIQVPGFHDSAVLAEVNTTPSFCFCEDPDPYPRSILILRADLTLQHTTFTCCRACCNFFSILHKNQFLQITSNFAIHFRLLDALRRAKSESIETWLELIGLVNNGQDQGGFQESSLFESLLESFSP